MVNNWCDAFNRSILKARNKPIITLLNSINTIVMTRIQQQRDAMRKHDGAICPRISKILRKRELAVGSYNVIWNGGARYQVSTGADQFVVDVVERTCTCRIWQLSGLPCLHSFAVIHERGDMYEDYVHDSYMKDTFLRVYDHLLEPVCGPSMWRRSEATPVLPPLLRKLPGRPKRCRRKDPNEDREREERAATEASRQASLDANGVRKVGRKGSKMHCSYKGCGSDQHNRRKCPLRLADEAANDATASTTDGAPTQPQIGGQDHSTESQDPSVNPVITP